MICLKYKHVATISNMKYAIARKMGARHAIARVRSPEYVNQIDFMRNELSISMMVNPDMSVASEISRILKFPTATNYETFANGKIDMIEISIKEGNNIIDKPIYEISQIYGNEFLICAVKRGEEVFIPNGNFIIRESLNHIIIFFYSFIIITHNFFH